MILFCSPCTLPHSTPITCMFKSFKCLSGFSILLWHIVFSTNGHSNIFHPTHSSYNVLWEFFHGEVVFRVLLLEPGWLVMLCDSWGYNIKGDTSQPGSLGMFVLGTQLSCDKGSLATIWRVHVKAFQLITPAKFPVSSQHHWPDIQ